MSGLDLEIEIQMDLQSMHGQIVEVLRSLQASARLRCRHNSMRDRSEQSSHQDERIQFVVMGYPSHNMERQALSARDQDHNGHANVSAPSKT